MPSSILTVYAEFCEIPEAELRRLPAWAQPSRLQARSRRGVNDAPCVPSTMRLNGDSGKFHSLNSRGMSRGTPDAPSQLLHQIEDQHFTRAGYVESLEPGRWIHPPQPRRKSRGPRKGSHKKVQGTANVHRAKNYSWHTVAQTISKNKKKQVRSKPVLLGPWAEGAFFRVRQTERLVNH